MPSTQSNSRQEAERMDSPMVLRGSLGEAEIQQSEDREADEAKSGPPSPFITGTWIQYAWDATSIGLLKRCARLYKYTIIDNWQPREEGVHLRWGGEFHKAMEIYEHARAKGTSHDDSVRFVVRSVLQNIEGWDPEPLTKSEEKKTKNALVRSVVWYLDHYEDNPAKTVILENGKPAVELSFQFELGYGPADLSYDMMRPEKADEEDWWNKQYILCGHLDKIVEYQGDRYVVDYKTASSTPGDYWFKQWQPENQMTCYTIAGQVLMSAPIKGVILDALQVAVDFSRPVRGFTMRSGDELEEWLADLRMWLQQAVIYATNDHWPMNDTACDKYGGCKFRTVCCKPAQVRQQWLEGAFTQENERWNPLKAR